VRRVRAALVLALAAWAALAAQAFPVAFVADIRGNATIEGDGKLTFLAELAAGTRLLLGTNATAAITYASSGAEFSIVGPGQFMVSAEEVTAEKGSKPKRRTVAALGTTGVVARAAQTATASLRMRGLAPGTTPAVLEYPVATRVSTLRPTMRWRENPGEEYTVVLQDVSGKELWKGRGSGAGTRLPVPLAAQARYTWSVAGLRGPLGEAEFETLPAEAMRRVEKSRAAATTFPDRVVHALLLQELGADHEAREAWGDLSRERPDMPELPALAR
jgi:hypothetical protein